MTKNENNDSFMRDKNIMRAVDGKRKSHFAWPNCFQIENIPTRSCFNLEMCYLDL